MGSASLTLPIEAPLIVFGEDNKAVLLLAALRIQPVLPGFFGA